ncbi:MAG: oligopeptide transporter, OPT family [Myxococcales bacterium]|nr:oligopeptide transporter, OPT family [Myxococcales bacterium]
MKSDSGSTRELTLRVVLIGLVLAVVMGAANVYLGLRAGMTVSASIPAAVIGMLVLRGLFRDGTKLEANQIQTAASAGESLAAGIIFTMPALILIGVWQKFDFWTTTLIAFTGGLLGILFMIPMRRVFVIRDDDELKFPEGVACAAVLDAGHSEDADNKSEAMGIIYGALFGATFKFCAGFLGLFKESLEAAREAFGRYFYFGSESLPALVAVGVIVRLNIAVLIFFGGALSWLILLPMLGTVPGSDSALSGAKTLFGTQIKYVGVGAMLVGGIASIWKVRDGLVQAIAELRGRKKTSQKVVDTERDIPGSVIVFFSILATVLVAGIYFKLTGKVTITIATTIIMLVMSFFFTAVASYIVGLVGNSNSPVSGMTITAVLFTGGMLALFGFSGEQGMLATLGVAAIVCCAACTSGDVCNDLKTGHMVGAAPYRQQMMQIMGISVAALVMAPVMQLLHSQDIAAFASECTRIMDPDTGTACAGIGGERLPAPQAGLFASLARGFFGDGQLPWDMVCNGVAIGLALLVVDEVLKDSGSEFRAHIMPIAVGMYLPMKLSTPILAGGLIAHFVLRRHPKSQHESLSRRGTLFASGAIAGEALMGVGLAILAATGVKAMQLTPASAMQMASVAVAVIVLVAFYRAARPRV